MTDQLPEDIRLQDKAVFTSGLDLVRTLLYAEVGACFEREDDGMSGEALAQRVEDRAANVRMWANLMSQSPELAKVGMVHLSEFAGEERGKEICEQVKRLCATAPAPEPSEPPRIHGSGGYL